MTTAFNNLTDIPSRPRASVARLANSIDLAASTDEGLSSARYALLDIAAYAFRPLALTFLPSGTSWRSYSACGIHIIVPAYLFRFQMDNISIESSGFIR